MTTPDQNEARREAIQSLGDVISELPGILHPYNTATAVYAAGWRPPLSTPEASDDEREARVAAVTAVGDLDWSPKFGKSDLASAPSDEELANTAIDVYLAVLFNPEEAS